MQTAIMRSDARNYTIDMLRAIGAFCVIMLHMPYSDLSARGVSAMSLCARWAVPFFFLVSGYFFEKKSKANLDQAFMHVLKNLVAIFALANIVYLFIALKTEYYTAADIFSVKSLILGDYIHLWFIGSMIFGYITLWFFLSLKMEKLLPSVAAGTLVFILLYSPYSVLTGPYVEGHLSRFLLSIPFLFIGFMYSRFHLEQRFSKWFSVGMMVAGFALQYIESYILFSFRKEGLFAHEFLFGTFLFSMGVFMLSFAIVTPKDTILSRIGRNYSLMIYLYHPLLIVVTFFAIKKVGLQNSSYTLWFNPVLIFMATLLIVKFLSNKYPNVYKVISGRV
ncbi:Surface polysaccharide O-acyltransferase, integral membrane enzyme [Hymenobacter mucosus]|uniref:Surface polysaccharide O-acyltransferase, integral membrane enzyme n=2 Tax=Hymenobacter mucosus TaxID=1411120 RepID=A0A238ZTJ5_9BACT|nr:Surface polysaccharide O-acyltransferase, integral membrane enzyme [Hymenobacter mucosus]